jgi:hypothetical protein
MSTAPGKELDIEYATTIWDRTGIVLEEWLPRNAAHSVMRHDVNFTAGH